MPRFRVGYPMWAHRSWIGRWLPGDTKPGTELAAYARLCNAVEGNTTFYAEPAAATVARWAEQAPVDFRFAFKLPREVTHDRRLQQVAEPVRSFLNRIEPLASGSGWSRPSCPRHSVPTVWRSSRRSYAGCPPTLGGRSSFVIRVGSIEAMPTLASMRC